MAIQRTYGASAVAAAGQAAGQARIKETQAAQALQMQQFREQLAHADAVRKMNLHWDLERESRARAWEIEKLETASRIDNELENKNYIKKMSQWQAGDEYIDSIADKHPPEQVTMMRFTLDQQFAKDIPKAAARLGVGLYEQEKKKEETKLLEKQQKEEKPPSRTDITAAIKFLGEYDEKKNRRLWSKIWDPFAPGPTQEEDKAAEYFKDVLNKAGIGTPQPTPEYTPPNTISTGLPTVNNDADFDALGSGQEFIDPDGVKRRKP